MELQKEPDLPNVRNIAGTCHASLKMSVDVPREYTQLVEVHTVEVYPGFDRISSISRSLFL